jgi:hypothetical protein
MNIELHLNPVPQPAARAQSAITQPSAQPPASGASPLLDVAPLLRELANITGNELLVPKEIQEHLNAALTYLKSSKVTTAVPLRSNENINVAPRTSELNVKLNHITTLEILYKYPPGAVLEYPETSSTGCIGHLFQLDPDDWQNPAQNFAYSQGKPNGQTLDGKYVHVSVLIDSLGKKVPCVESHSTCTPTLYLLLFSQLIVSTGQGSKICPYADIGLHTVPHIRASREDVKERLQNNRDHRLQCSSPKRDIFLHTVSFIAALERYGCRWKRSAHTQVLSCEEQQQKERRGIYRHQTQRGYRKPDSDEPICEGRIVFDYNRADQPYIRYISNVSHLRSGSTFPSCEYYDRNTNQAHFHDFNITNGSYDIDYLEAVFCGDQQETARIEEDAYACGYGPLVDCTSVSNFSTQKAFCREYLHRF